VIKKYAVINGVECGHVQ